MERNRGSQVSQRLRDFEKLPKEEGYKCRLRRLQIRSLPGFDTRLDDCILSRGTDVEGVDAFGTEMSRTALEH
ncbi:hypothetical protein DHEL01_v206066 [Diaporthe helianthi]|uniref:Uncharacterized protein n=1 Tax=Diaporthe helianthi TaxID=158607 RepID=A0A2P5HZ91_DIAHE|nr:hypothetical protein DHEL01_v206066 [Diaporthe helianthi]